MTTYDPDPDFDNDELHNLRSVPIIRPNIDVEFGVIQYEVERISRHVAQIGWLIETTIPQLHAALSLLADQYAAQTQALNDLTCAITCLTETVNCK